MPLSLLLLITKLTDNNILQYSFNAHLQPLKFIEPTLLLAIAKRHQSHNFSSTLYHYTRPATRSFSAHTCFHILASSSRLANPIERDYLTSWACAHRCLFAKKCAQPHVYRSIFPSLRVLKEAAASKQRYPRADQRLFRCEYFEPSLDCVRAWLACVYARAKLATACVNRWGR